MYIDEDHEEYDKKKRKTHDKKKITHKSNHSIPSFDKFCKMNYVFIPAKIKSRKEESDKDAGGETIKFINGTIYEKKVRKKLLEIYKSYWHKFERICEEVITSKYKKIYDNIYHFIIFLKFCKESFIRTILLNTDQNANDFFQSMENYFDRISGVKRKSKKKESHEMDEVEEEIEANKMIFFLTESRFKDMKSLYKYLEICDTNNIWLEGDKPMEKKIRLLIIREIHKIDTINFNIFISRILEYHQDQNSEYYYVLIFDVSYDPRGLFEKIKPNNLCKIVFNNVENVSSKNIYKEILYKYIYEEPDTIFIPNPLYTKKIVDYVNNHQISIKSFKHYFKFVIIDFFLLNSWKRDEYLIYSHMDCNIKDNNPNKYDRRLDNTAKKKEKSSKKNNIHSEEDDLNYKKVLENIFLKKLNKIYGGYEKKSKEVPNEEGKSSKCSNIFKKSDVDHLVTKFHERRRIIDVFLHLYDFFEKLTEEISKNNKDVIFSPVESAHKQEKSEPFDKYQFFFDFLQLGAHPDIATNNRLLIIKKSFENTVDYLELIKKIAVNLEIHLKSLDQSCSTPHEMLKDLYKIINEKGAKVRYSNEINNKRNKEQLNETIENRLPLLDRDEYKRKLLDWLNNFLKMDELVLLFEDFNKNIHSLINEKRTLISAYSKYIEFQEIVNPSFSTIVIDSMQGISQVMASNNSKKSKGNNSNNIINDDQDTGMIDIEEQIDYTKCNQYILLKQFLILFSQASAEFKLKFLYVEFLNQLLIDKENKAGVTTIKHYFLYFCHIFYLLGLITRKRAKDDIYLKNYYQMTNYFVKR